MANASTIVQDYQKAMATLEEKLKNPALAPSKIPKLQEQLVEIADKYQNDESIGAERYKIYELQGLIFFYQNNDEEALRLLDAAQGAYGANYEYAQGLQDQILNENPDIHYVQTKREFDGMSYGRLDQVGYLLGIVGIFLSSYVIGLGAAFGFSFITAFAGTSDTLTVIAMVILGTIIAAVSVFMLFAYLGITIRRFHDLSMSGWWALTILVPYASLIIILILLFAPGKQDVNKYGRLRRPRNIRGVLLGR